MLNRKRSSDTRHTRRDEMDLDTIPNADKIVTDAPRMALPLTLQPLCTVKVVVGGKKSKSGSPSSICAKLWVD